MASCMALAFGLSSYASEGFNPDVQIGVLNTSTGLLESDPVFKPGGVYTLQLSAVLPTANEVNSEENATGYAIGAVASGGVQVENLNVINTWTGSDPYPTFAGLNVYSGGTDGQPSQSSVNFLTQIVQGDLAGIPFSSGQDTGTPKLWGTEWSLTLTSEFVTFLEANGYTAATTTEKAGATAGLEPRERFGVTFQAQITSASSGGKNAVTAWAGWPANSSEAPAEWSGASKDVLNMGPQAQTNESHLNVQLGEIKAGLLDEKSKIEAEEGSKISFQVASPLPDPSSMTGASSYFAFELMPSLGLTLTDLENAEVGGLPLSSLLSGWKAESSGSSGSVEGGNFSYWTLKLTSADIAEIEKDGFAPATSSSPQSSTPGISAGSPFALTFTGQLNSDASGNTSLKAKVGFMSDAGWSLVSSQEAQIAVAPQGVPSAAQAEGLSLNLLNSQGLVDTSSPHYYMTKLESSPDPAQIIASHTGAHTFQISLPLPDPAQMTGDKSVLVIKNIPGQGLAVENPDFIQQIKSLTYIGDITVAGLPLTIFRNVFAAYTDRPFVVSPDKMENGMIEGTADGSNWWELVLTKSEIEEIEAKGSPAATSSSPQGKAAGLKPGDEFAITFTGFVTTAASGKVTDEAQAAWASQSFSSASGSGSSSQGASAPAQSAQLKNISTVSSQTISLFPKDLEVQPAANLNVVSSGYQNPYPYAGIGTPMEFQLEAALPDPAQMSGEWASFDLVDVPRAGISVENPKEAPSDFEIAGLPLLSIPGIQVTSPSSSQWIEGDDMGTESFEVEMSAQSVEYVEKNGFAPATLTAQQGTAAGISPGSLFALTFTGELNASAPSQQSTCRDTAYSQYQGTLGGKTVEDKSSLASRGVEYNGVSTPLTAQLGVINQSTGMLEKNPVYQPGENIEFQLTVTLPNPSDLQNTSAAANSYAVPGWYAVQIAPGAGLNVDTYYAQSVSVAGLSFQNSLVYLSDPPYYFSVAHNQGWKGEEASLSGSSENDTEIPSKDAAYWGIAFSAKDLEYIEQNGESPATYTSQASYPAGGLKPGDKFAITFMGQLNSDASASNPLYAFVGYQSNYPQNPAESSGWWTVGGAEAQIAWENSGYTSSNGGAAGSGSGSGTSGGKTEPMWKYQLSSYRQATVWVGENSPQTPSNQIEVLENGKPEQDASYPQNAPITFRVSSSLPPSNAMTGNFAYYRVEISPKSGISVYNGALSSDVGKFTIGSVPVSSIPGAYMLSSSSAQDVEGGGSLTLILPPSAVSYIQSHNLSSDGSFDLEFTGFLNQSASTKARANVISSTSSYSSAPTAAASLSSSESQTSVQESEEQLGSLPLTGSQGISLFMASLLGALLLAAGAGCFEAAKRFGRR
ncbi:MAG: hypothetical protein IKS61_00885 [Aeriscardovia sp.]|nr:hypothetical protein [Aeriscardovia sp.]